MANLSDAFGTIRAEKVGKEFVEYLKTVQGTEEKAYYKLLEIEDLNQIEVDESGDFSVSFSTFGRWSYETNLDGYLKGDWSNFKDDNDEGKAYSKFIEAVLDKDGLIEVTYTDSDAAMDWMGNGVYTVSVQDGEVDFSHTFENQPLTIQSYAEANGYTDYEALEYLHGDEIATKYDKYVEDWKKEHEFKKGESEPAGPAEWYDNEYEEE